MERGNSGTENHGRARGGLKTRSCSSTKTDAYRAGLELGEALAEIDPEVVFLFSSIHYGDSPELAEALYDALGNEDLVLIGTTGDGFYELERVADSGVSALGIHSGGVIGWRVERESGVGAQPAEATRRCMRRLKEGSGGESPALYYLATDFRTDTSEIIGALREEADAPVVGGSAGDDTALEHCFVRVGREVLTDSIAILAIDGPLCYEIMVAHHLQPMGRVGVITSSDATTIHEVDDIPALDFIERELGKPLDEVDEGIITFKLTREPQAREHLIRSILLPDRGTGGAGVKLFGGIEDCRRAQVCLAPAERIIGEVREMGRALGDLPFTPSAALVVSCAGRKRVLADNIEREVLDLVEGAPSLTALAGYPSFGEFGPVKGPGGYSATSYHNMTFILLLLGEGREEAR